jgi:hypothetical protein
VATFTSPTKIKGCGFWNIREGNRRHEGNLDFNTLTAQVRHRVVSIAIANLSPESLAIFPDGSKVVTVIFQDLAGQTND